MKRRRKIFTSPLLTPEVREKLDSGGASLKKVAETILAIEAEEPAIRGVPSAFEERSSSPDITVALDRARNALNERIAEAPTDAARSPSEAKTVRVAVCQTAEGIYTGEEWSPWGARQDRLEVTVEQMEAALVVVITQKRVGARRP